MQRWKMVLVLAALSLGAGCSGGGNDSAAGGGSAGGGSGSVGGGGGDIDDDGGETTPTRFRVTLTNTIGLLRSDVFNEPLDAEGNATGNTPPVLMNVGERYEVDFSAVPGTYLSFASMQANSNDWFFAPAAEGIALYDGEGNPIDGDVTDEVYLWDAGTEATDPTYYASARGPDSALGDGGPDSDNTVRIEEMDVSGLVTVEITSNGNYSFTLTITREGAAVPTPGIAVVHTPLVSLFTGGQPAPANGLRELAELGTPMPLYDWINEVGSAGAPLRRAVAHTPLSPSIAYTFASETDPLFTQGEAASAASGLEVLAEDGSPMEIYDYLTGEGYEAAVTEAGAGPGGTHVFELDAVPGDKLGFASMFVQSNDWFLAFNNNGVALFDDAGNPREGTFASEDIYLFDAGTEVDQPVGTGADQPMRGGAGTGADDEDDTVRRVAAADDARIQGGEITSSAGVAWLGDPRGGYNLAEITIEVVPGS